MTLRPCFISFATLAALVLSGSSAFAQQQVPPPTQAPAPVERQTPSGRMGSGMGMEMHPRMERNSRFQRSAEDFRRSHEEGMDDGFHIGPGGMWWKNPMLVERLALTPDQVSKMDAIFQESRLQLIDLKANVERQQVILEPMLSANPLDTTHAMEQIDKVADARADLEKASAKMLLGIRAILTPDQWTKLNDRHGMRGSGEGPRNGAPMTR